VRFPHRGSTEDMILLYFCDFLTVGFTSVSHKAIDVALERILCMYNIHSSTPWYTHESLQQ
jgi:hypothetical protein